MQRKFLEDLGLEKDIIDKIMTENGNDIEKTKSKLEAERDNYKGQLETAQNALKEFEGVDVKDLQGKIDTLNNTLQTKETEYQNRIADMEFNAVLDGELSKVGAKNTKAVKALLDLDSLKASKNQAEDIKTALETVKGENDYLFTSEEPFKNPVRETVNLNSDKKMSLIEAMKYKNEHPDADVNSLI